MSSAADNFFNAFRRALNEHTELSETERRDLRREVDKAIANEPIPTIAIIGEAGVGKSTTLNALFNAGAITGHGIPTTKSADDFDVEISDHHGNKGDIRVIDFPGLGESMERSAELAALYARHLPGADAILWVHPAADRMLEFTEQKIYEIFHDGLRDRADRLVFGLNKADEMYPMNWRLHANVPSEEQLRNLQVAEQHFADVIQRVLPRRTQLRVTTYSALQYYNLARLFTLLMEGMPKKRRWVLEQRMDLADFTAKADPRFLAGLQGHVPGPGPEEPAQERVPPRDRIVSQMTEADLRFCAQRGISPEDWWLSRRNK
jgi:uncharacterized protein